MGASPLRGIGGASTPHDAHKIHRKVARLRKRAEPNVRIANVDAVARAFRAASHPGSSAAGHIVSSATTGIRYWADWVELRPADRDDGSLVSATCAWLQLHYAQNKHNVNGGIAAYEDAFDKAGIKHELYPASPQRRRLGGGRRDIT